MARAGLCLFGKKSNERFQSNYELPPLQGGHSIVRHDILPRRKKICLLRFVKSRT